MQSARRNTRAAKEKFVEVQEAYDILSDDQKRANYDQFGHAGEAGAGGGPSGAGGFGGFGGFPGAGGPGGGPGADFFSDIFRQFAGGAGGPRGGMNREAEYMGSDLQTGMRITFMEAVKGTQKTLDYQCITKCGTCTGSGLKAGAKPKTCERCGGRGQVVFVRGEICLLLPDTFPFVSRRLSDGLCVPSMRRCRKRHPRVGKVQALWRQWRHAGDQEYKS